MGIEPVLVASSIVAIQAQRLVRKVCPYCKRPYTAPPELLERIQDHLPKGELNFVKAEGCKRCGQSGYMGRTLISEVFQITEEIAEAVTRGATKQQLYELAVAGGFETMFTDGVHRAAEGVTTLDEVLRVAKL